MNFILKGLVMNKELSDSDIDERGVMNLYREDKNDQR